MKIIAFYLPQFHEIPENNEWWGEGFTEWVNVKKAKSLFDGHIQPREPLNDNYYDLSDNNVMSWQIEIAKKYGIYGFCFYHYWFDGHMLLQKPMEQFLKNKEQKMPFCICWANEHWTNAWVSKENKVLIEQRYGGRKEWEEHFNYLLQFFQDDRYIIEDNKPLMVIYRPEIIECLNDMLDCWSELARKNGFDGIKYAYQHPAFVLEANRDDSRFDYNIEYQPTYAQIFSTKNKYAMLKKIKRKIAMFCEKYLKMDIRYVGKGLVKYSYDEMWKFIVEMEPVTSKSIPGAFVNWDNSPRRGNRGIVYTGVTPEKFEKYLSIQIKRAREVYHSDKLFIFAWNEWAEGGYLEPDKLWKYRMLEAIKKSLELNNEYENEDI